MKILYNGEEIATVYANRSLTIEEALYYALGYDVNDPDDCKKAYDEDFPTAYIDDFGNYCIDTEELEMEGV